MKNRVNYKITIAVNFGNNKSDTMVPFIEKVGAKMLVFHNEKAEKVGNKQNI